MGTAVLAAALSFCLLRKLQKESFSEALNVALFALPAALVLGRIFYCWFGKSSFTGLGDCFSLANGGYGLYGALAGLLTVILIFCRVRRQSVLPMIDAAVPPVAAVIAVGRFASITSGDDIGFDVSSPALEHLPFILWSEAEQSYILWVGFWEGIAAAVIFVFTLTLFAARYGFGVRGLGDGCCVLMFMLTYGLSQAMLESMRNDSLYMVTLGFVKISQIISILMGVTAAVIVAVRSIRLKKPDVSRIVLWSVCAAALGLAVYCEFEMNAVVMVRHYIMMGLSLAFIMAASVYVFFRNATGRTESLLQPSSALSSPQRKSVPPAAVPFVPAAVPAASGRSSGFDDDLEDDFDNDSRTPLDEGVDNGRSKAFPDGPDDDFEDDFRDDWDDDFDDDFS